MRYTQEVLTPLVPPKDLPRKPLLPPSDMGVRNPMVLDQKTGPSSDARPPRPPVESQPTPPKPSAKKKRGSPQPPSPADEKRDRSETQCSAQTKAGKRCSRPVNIGPPLTIVHPEAEDVKRFCFQHVKESQSAFYLEVKGGSEFIKFEGTLLGSTSGSCLKPLIWANF